MQWDEILFKCTVVFKKYFFNFHTSIIHIVSAELDPVGNKMLRLLKNAESIQNSPNKIAGVLHAGSFLKRCLIQCILSPITNQTSFQSPF